MKLISEQPVVLSPVIEEAAGDNKEPEYFLEGIFMQAEIKNRNGRIYPLDIMKREVARYDREYVQTHRAFGELGHPNGKPDINLDRVSHIITKIWQDGNYFKARAKILNTPCGKIVQEMIKAGCQLGVSSRALGSTTVKEGVSYVNSDFHLITAGDIVFEPSAQAAFPTGIINEEVEWDIDPITGQYVQTVKADACKCDDTNQGDCCDAQQEKSVEVLLGELEAAKKTIATQQQELNELKNKLVGLKQLREFDKLLQNIK